MDLKRFTLFPYIDNILTAENINAKAAAFLNQTPQKPALVIHRAGTAGLTLCLVGLIVTENNGLLLGRIYAPCIEVACGSIVFQRKAVMRKAQKLCLFIIDNTLTHIFTGQRYNHLSAHAQNLMNIFLALQHGYRQSVFRGRFGGHQTGRSCSYNNEIIHVFHVVPPVS